MKSRQDLERAMTQAATILYICGALLLPVPMVLAVRYGVMRDVAASHGGGAGHLLAILGLCAAGSLVVGFAQYWRRTARRLPLILEEASPQRKIDGILRMYTLFRAFLIFMAVLVLVGIALDRDALPLSILSLTGLAVSFGVINATQRRIAEAFGR